MSSRKPEDLRDRSLEFSKLVIRYLQQLKTSHLNNPLKVQLVRSATSIGANFVEAKNASSPKDFRNKVFICKKESSESLYWLQILEEFDNSDDLTKLQHECQEIILILQKIINNTKPKH